MRCGPRRALPNTGEGAALPAGGGPFVCPGGGQRPACAPQPLPFFVLRILALAAGGGRGGGDAGVPPAPAGAGWVLAPNSRGSWVWLREAPGSCPAPGEWGGVASSQLPAGAGGGRGLSSWPVPEGCGWPPPWHQVGNWAGSVPGTPDLLSVSWPGCQRPDPGGFSVPLLAPWLLCPHCAAAVGAVWDPSCPEPPDHAHPSGGSFLILMRNTFSMC